MCYMATRKRTVGVRELRQNLSKYLRRVQKGESLEVTERGRPVAMLTPLPETTSVLERLIAEGKVIPAKKKWGDLPRLRGPISDRLSKALEEVRADRL